MIKKTLLLTFCLWLACLGVLKAQNTFPQNGPADPKTEHYALIHVNIQLNPATLLKDATLIVKNGKIEAVGNNIPVPADALVIDGKGKYVYPSFIDLYSNYGINPPKNKSDRTDQYKNNQKGAYAWNDAVHLDVNAVDYFQYDEKKSKQYLSSGIGICLSGTQEGIFRGSSALVLTGKDAEQKLILKPVAAGGLSFNKGSSAQEYPGSAMGCVALIRQTYLDADWYAKQKTEVNLSFENYRKLKGVPAVFEAENKLAVLRAGRIANEFGVSYIIKGKGDEYQRLEEIAALHMPLIIPMNFPKPYEVEDPFDAMNINLADLKHWELAPSNAAFLMEKKVPFTITSYGCEPADFLKNLRKAVQMGLSEEEALKALTTRPAELMKVDKQTGTLQKGMMANFFISSAPIFTKDAIIEEHFVNGKRHKLEESPVSALVGTYTLKLQNYEDAQLVLSGKTKQLEGKLYAKDTLKVNVSEQGDLLLLNFPESKTGDKRVRVEAWISAKDSNGSDAQYLKGIALFSSGNSSPFLATRTRAAAVKPKPADSVQRKVPGKIIYPFTEYGNEVLPKAQTYVFKNATVWTNEPEGILSETDVAISNGKIIAIGKDLKIQNAIVIDAKGKHLTNGIIDEHSHLAIYRGVNECTQNITAEVRIGDVINCDDINIYRQLSGGVIACQQLHGSCNPVGGQSSLIKLRWGMAPEQMKIEGADGFIKFALGENVKRSSSPFDTERYPRSRMGVEQVYYDAFIRAREYEAQLKANPDLCRRDLEMETMLEILRGKRFISCHSYVQSEINMLMHVADSMGFKVNTFTHILEGYKVADKMKAHGVNASTFADWWAYKYEVIDAIPQNAVILNKMGVCTAINSDDAEMGRRLNQEAAKMMKYGNMSAQDAWKMVTLNPAKMLHLDKRTGSIKVGKDADLVLWSADPLSIEAKAEMTFVDGVCYFNRSLDLEKRKEIQQERMRIILLMIQAKQGGEKTEKKVSEPDPDYHCEDF